MTSDVSGKGLTAAEIAASSPFALARMVQIDGEHGPEPLILWPKQRRILRALWTRRRVIILKARQLGVTWLLALYALWFAISHSTVTIIIVSLGEREAKRVRYRVKRLYESLPEPVRRAYPVIVDTHTEFTIGHPEGPSVISILPASDSAGRGETAHLVIGDEAPHWEHSEERISALAPTAEDVGQLILAGTANGVGGYFHTTYLNADEEGFEPIFVGADSRPGRDAIWIEAARRRAKDKGPQEYPMSAEEAFLASGRCVFSMEALADYLERGCRPPLWRGVIERDRVRVFPQADRNGGWRVWEWPEPGRQYLIAADVCGSGGGRDFAAAAVYDAESWNQVAAFHARVEPRVLTRDLVRAGWLWRGSDKPALLVPEANDHGRAVLAYLREWRYPNVWAHTRIDQRRDVRQTEFGWLTTSATRPVLIASLQEGVREGQLGIRDRYAIIEMQTFVEKENGRQEAEEGCNDDRVLAHGIAAVVLQRVAAGGSVREAASANLRPYRVARRGTRTGY